MKENLANQEKITVVVKETGKRKEKVVATKDSKKENKEALKCLFNHNSSVDLFKDIVHHGKHMYEPHPI
jgi:hypothetical protein